MAHDSTIAVDEGQGTGQASVEAAGQRLRGCEPPWFSTQWLPDTAQQSSHDHRLVTAAAG
jgi:hypothetical protein